MEHGGDRHVDIFLMQAPLAGNTTQRRHAGEGVEDQLAVAEVDSLGHAGGAGGVKGGGPGVFIEIGKLKVISRLI